VGAATKSSIWRRSICSGRDAHLCTPLGRSGCASPPTRHSSASAVGLDISFAATSASGRASWARQSPGPRGRARRSRGLHRGRHSDPEVERPAPRDEEPVVVLLDQQSLTYTPRPGFSERVLDAGVVPIVLRDSATEARFKQVVEIQVVAVAGQVFKEIRREFLGLELQHRLATGLRSPTTSAARRAPQLLLPRGVRRRADRFDGSAHEWRLLPLWLINFSTRGLSEIDT
jgi:hypothetical protein